MNSIRHTLKAPRRDVRRRKASDDPPKPPIFLPGRWYRPGDLTGLTRGAMALRSGIQRVRETEALAGRIIERAYVDKGYRGHDADKPRRVFRSLTTDYCNAS